MKTKKKTYKIFIYGMCQKGQPHHGIMKNAIYNGVDCILNWIMVDITDRAIVLPFRNHYNRGSIIVEVYTIPAEDLSKYDEFFNCPKELTREVVRSKRGVEGILYFLKENESTLKGKGKPVKDGNWVNYVLRNKKKKDMKDRRKKNEEEQEKAENKKKQEEAKKKKLKQQAEEA